MSIISFESRLASEESLETFLQTLMMYPWRYTLYDIQKRWLKEAKNGKEFIIPTVAIARIAPYPLELVRFYDFLKAYSDTKVFSPKFTKFIEEYIQTYENLEDLRQASLACILYSQIIKKRFGEEVILKGLRALSGRTKEALFYWVKGYCENNKIILTDEGFKEKTAKKKKAYGLDQSGVVKDQNDIGSGQQNILDIMKQDADVHPQEVLLKQREKDEQPPRKYRSVI